MAIKPSEVCASAMVSVSTNIGADLSLHVFGNTISGNSGDGVLIQTINSGASSNNVFGNFIGTNKTGLSAVANGGAGLELNATVGNFIGELNHGAGNVISGNTGNGVLITNGAASNQVLGNHIGTNVTGTSAVANGLIGVEINGGSNNSIGGRFPVQGNVNSGNTGDGVRVTGANDSQNEIAGNSIYLNGGLGTNLGTDGVTPNDPQINLDADTGPNMSQNFPVLSAAAADTQIISGRLYSSVDNGFTIDFYASPSCGPSGNGEGNIYLGSQAADPANGDGSSPFTFTATPGTFNSGDVITATATLNGNTSEFSVCLVATGSGAAVINVNEQISVTDTATVLRSTMIAVNEQINVLDTPTVLPSAMLSVNEQINVLDTTTVSPAAMIGVNENISVNDAVSTHRVLVTFPHLLTAGETSAVPIDPFSVGPPPNGLNIIGPAFDITTTATFTPPINVCFTLPEFTDQNLFLHLAVLHGEPNAGNQIALVDRTSSHDFSTNTVCGQVNSLSPFVIAQVQAPTAVPATISGQVTAGDGASLGGVTVILSGAHSRLAVTVSQGRYSFGNVKTDSFYTVTPALANYTFVPANRSFSLVANKTDAVFTATPDAVPALNPLDTTGFFVRQQYLDFLGREPDQGGLNYWTAQINQCLSEPPAVAGRSSDCIRQRRLDVSAAFFASAEFQQTGSYIYGMYAGTLGRAPGYNEFMSDRVAVVAGPNLNASKIAFADAFVQRPEFSSKCSETMTREEFVDALLQTMSMRLGIDLSSLRATMLSDYDTGGRSLAVRDAVQANAFAQAEYNRAFVLMEYFGYLRRDVDQSGYDYWLDILNHNGAGNSRGMVCAFVTSAEYQQRFGSVITHPNDECGPK